MTAPPKGKDPNNISDSSSSNKKVKGHPQPKKGTSRNTIPAPTGDFALPPPMPVYFEQDGLRKVKPYMFTYHSWAKERWQGRTLIDIYSEFRDRTQEYYEWAIETGIIVVNNRKATPDQIIQNGDLISNVAHRHEPPVVAGPIKIIYDGRLPGNDGKTLVVEKPGSMPIHSTGRYNFNTLLEILKYDYDLPMVHTSNRLDRLTSGVMICSLTVEASKQLGAWFGGQRESGVKKEYVARCFGEFPEETIVCEEPLLTLDRQIGVNVVHPDGRESRTIFERMSYDPKSNTSVVLCRPITGRTHQIRVHLQFLGHPIANDPIYQNFEAWGESGGKGGVYPSPSSEAAEARRARGEAFMSAEKEKEQQNGYSNVKEGEEGVDRKLVPDLSLTEGASRAIRALRGVRDEADGWARDRDVEGLEKARKYQEEQGEEVELSKREEEDEEEGFCKKCFTPLIPDPKPEQLFIWLHAMRYTTTEWDWKSELPYWAEPTYNTGERFPINFLEIKSNLQDQSFAPYPPYTVVLFKFSTSNFNRFKFDKVAHSRRSSVPNVSPLSRSSPLPPLTSIHPPSSTHSNNIPPPPYTAPLPPPIRSRSVPHLNHLSTVSPHTTDSLSLSPELQQWSPSHLHEQLPPNGPHPEVSSRRVPRPTRSRTSSSTSLGLSFGARSRLPSFEESTSLYANGGSITAGAGVNGRAFDSDEDDALEIQASARALRRRQMSENSTLSQRRPPGNGDGRFGRTRSAEGTVPQPPSTSATSPTTAPNRSRIWTPLFFLLNFLSVIPSLIGFLYSAHRFYTTPRLVVSSLQWETSTVTYSRSTRLDWFISGMWALACAYFTHSLARGLLKRWLVYYPLGPTIVRVLSLQAICWPLTLTTHRVLSFDQPVAAWFVCATTAAISNVIQSWVTSNIIERKDRRGQPSWKFVSSAITAVLGPGIRTDKYRKGERVLSWKRVLWGTVLPFALLGWATTNALLWQQFVARYKGGGGVDLGPPKLNSTISTFPSRLSTLPTLESPTGVRILLLVSSSWSEQSRVNRQVFRDTSLELFSRSPLPSVSIDHRFLLGTAPTPQQASKFGLRIEEEASTYGDLLMVPSRDSVDDSTRKVFEGWKWARDIDADYVIKTEDDVFVRMDVIAKELSKLGKKKEYWRGFAYWNMPVAPNTESGYDLAQIPPYTDGTLHILSHDLVSLIGLPSSPRRITQQEDQSLGVWLFSTGVRPLHDHRIQQGQVCENDMIAKRFGGGTRFEVGAKEMYRNVVEGKKLCEGFKQRWCGVCYASCRKRDHHWRDAGIECDEVKGATLSISTSPSPYDLEPVKTSPSSKGLIGSEEDSWIVPDVLFRHSSPLSSTDEWHLLHFATWIDPSSPFTDRHFASLETILTNEPRAIIFILSTFLEDGLFESYREMGYSVQVVKIGKKEIIENEWWVGKETENWIRGWSRWSQGANFNSHLSDYLRYLVLFKYGGTIFDFDSLSLRSPPDSSLEFVGTGHSTLASDESWTLDEDGTYISTERLRLRRGWTILKEVLETTFSTRYSPDYLECTGTRALTTAYQPRRHRLKTHGFTLLPSNVLYPRSWIEAAELVKSLPQGQSRDYLERLDEIWSIHLWSKMTGHLPIQPGSIAAEVIDSFSLKPRNPMRKADSLEEEEPSISSSIELEHPQTYQYRSRISLVQARAENVELLGSLDGRFEGFNLIHIRSCPSHALFKVRLSFSASHGGRISFASKRGVGGGAREVVLDLGDVRLKDVNAILSELRYLPPKDGKMETDEVHLRVEIGEEKVEGKIVVNL